MSLSEDEQLNVSENAAPRIRYVVNVGSGPISSPSLHTAFRNPPWQEIRLDVDPAVAPDIVGSLTELGRFIEDASLEAIWSSHSLEHLHTHEVIRPCGNSARPCGLTGSLW